MTAKTIPRPRSPAPTAPTKRRRKRIHLSRAELDAMQDMYPENTTTLMDVLPQLPIKYYFMNALESHFRRIGKIAAVMGDMFIFYIEGETRARFAADMSVTLGVDSSEVIHDRQYYSWLLGALPNLVLDTSPRINEFRDLAGRFHLYKSLGISELWLMDAVYGDFFGPPFLGYRLVDGKYKRSQPEPNPSEGMIRFRSRVLGLDFCVQDGVSKLHYKYVRLYNPETGEYLPTHIEVNDMISGKYTFYEHKWIVEAEFRTDAHQRYMRKLEARNRQLEELLRQHGLL